MTELDDLTRQALGLGVDDRAKLAERLIESLDELSEQETAEIWATEAERRLRAYRVGEVQAIPAEQVMNDADDLLRRLSFVSSLRLAPSSSSHFATTDTDRRGSPASS